MNDQTLPLLALAMIPKLGPVSARSLITYCGSPQGVFDSPKHKLVRVPGIGPKIASSILARESLLAAEQELAYCEANGIQAVSYLDPAYPQALAYIHDSPLVLFQKGPLDLNAQLGIAIVGTRKATAYGKAQATEFAAFFASKGINVISGLAYGIDIAAHKAALKAGGPTTAVLGHGLDQLYPAHHRSQAAEIAQTGALLTEYPSGTAIDPGNFPARNRIVSGLCKAVIVIEAAASGGALITARFAFDQNREVFALPGRVGDAYSAGCNRLIRDQVARLITDPQEVLDELDIEWITEADGKQLEIADQAPMPALTENEDKVLTFLQRGDAQIDSIAMKTGLAMPLLNPLLLTMEFRGLIQQLPGKKFRKL